MKRYRDYGDKENAGLSPWDFDEYDGRDSGQPRPKKLRRLRSQRRSGHLRKQAQRDALR
jgi:hypothetical protein